MTAHVLRRRRWRIHDDGESTSSRSGSRPRQRSRSRSRRRELELPSQVLVEDLKDSPIPVVVEDRHQIPLVDVGEIPGTPSGPNVRNHVLTYPSFKLVEREPTRSGLSYQLGSLQSSAHGVESRQRSAPHIEVEDSSVDGMSGGMVSGERSHDTHSSREEMLDPEGASSNGAVTRERSSA